MPRRLADVSAHNAAQPATCGVAILVPLFVPYRVGRGTEEKTSRPGPAISILPKFENEEGVKPISSEATDMIVGELAGAPKKRGPARQIADTRDKRIRELERERTRWQQRAERAEALVELQKQVAALRGTPLTTEPS